MGRYGTNTLRGICVFDVGLGNGIPWLLKEHFLVAFEISDINVHITDESTNLAAAESLG